MNDTCDKCHVNPPSFECNEEYWCIDCYSSYADRITEETEDRIRENIKAEVQQ